MAEIAPRQAVTDQIVSLARFAVLATLALAALLLVADFLGRGWSDTQLRFLSEKIIATLLYCIAIEVVVAIAAILWLALRGVPGTPNVRAPTLAAGN